MTNAFLLIGGLHLYYTASGSGQPVVYVHGNTGSSRWFSKVLDIPGFQTFALDLPNFGRSSPLEGEPDLNVYADYVGKFIEALHLKSPIVVGHSLGGAVAQSLAVRKPDLVGGLVLVDSASPKGLITPRERYPFIEMMRKDRSILSKALASTVPSLKDPEFFESLLDDAVVMAEKAWTGNAEALSRFDIEDRTTSFMKPVLVIWGRGDFIVSELMAQDTARSYPKSRLKIIEGVGHSIIVENPETFIELLTDFANGSVTEK
ncbi:MAG: alpha/beta hydrolase [Rectinemataceae bacterium]|nr:alpha/beta hydrolase [Rectinemataceae bacterium]